MHFTFETCSDYNFSLALPRFQKLEHLLLIQGGVHKVLDRLSEHPVYWPGPKSLGEIRDLGRVKEGSASRLVGLNHEDGEVHLGGRGGVLLARRGHGEPDIRRLGGRDWVGN